MKGNIEKGKDEEKRKEETEKKKDGEETAKNKNGSLSIFEAGVTHDMEGKLASRSQ